MHILVLLVVAVVVLLIVGAVFIQRRKYIYDRYYHFLKKAKVCPTRSATKQAAQCTADAYIKKYGVWRMYDMLKQHPHKIAPQLARDCLSKYCS